MFCFSHTHLHIYLRVCVCKRVRKLRRLARHLIRIGFELFAECEKFVLRLYPMYLSNIASRTFERISMFALFAAPKLNHVHGSHWQIAGRFVRRKE